MFIDNEFEMMEENTNHIIVQDNNDKIVCELCRIIEQGRRQAYASANQVVIQLIGT